MLTEELPRRKIPIEEFEQRKKAVPVKFDIALRLRQDTMMTRDWIAQRLELVIMPRTVSNQNRTMDNIPKCGTLGLAPFTTASRNWRQPSHLRCEKKCASFRSRNVSNKA
jgi:hypothetical protein